MTDLNIHGVMKITLETPQTITPKNKARNCFNVQKLHIESDDGNIEINMFLK